MPFTVSTSHLHQVSKTYLKAAREAESELCWIPETVIEISAGYLGINLVQLLKCHGLIEVILAVVDEPHSVHEPFVRIPCLIFNRLPHVPEQAKHDSPGLLPTSLAFAFATWPQPQP